jgi:SSS family transporter
MDVKLLFFIIYCIIILFVGYLGYRKTKTLGDFYLAGRQLGKWIAAGTFAGTFVSAITFVSWIGFGWKFGTAILPVYIFGCLCGYIIYAIVAPKLNMLAHRNDIYTPSDYYEGRFNSSFLRLWTTIFTIIGFTLYLGIQLIGTGVLFEVILGIPFIYGVIILGVVYTIYTLMGGMKSVAWTDAIQFSLFVVATLVAFVYVLPKVGGISQMNVSLASIDPKLLTLGAGGTFKPLWIIGVGFAVTVVIPLHYGYISRAMACKTPRDAIGMVGIGSFILMIFYFAILILALSARVLMPDTAALTGVDKAFPTMVLEHFPVALGAFILVALGAAVMSTTDSILLQVGSNIANDIYKRYINKDAQDKRTLSIARIFVVIFAVITIIFALTKPAALYLIYNFFIVFLVAPYVAIFFFGLYWKKATKAGAVTSAIVGGGIGILIQALQIAKVAPPSLSYNATIYAVPVSVILMIVVSLASKKYPEEHVKKWF